jgi:hypothetical protein
MRPSDASTSSWPIHQPTDRVAVEAQAGMQAVAGKPVSWPPSHGLHAAAMRVLML